MPLNIIIPKYSMKQQAEILRQSRDILRQQRCRREQWLQNGGGLQKMNREMAERNREMAGARSPDGTMVHAGSMSMEMDAVLRDCQFDGETDYTKNYDAIDWLKKQPETSAMRHLKHLGARR